MKSKGVWYQKVSNRKYKLVAGERGGTVSCEEPRKTTKGLIVSWEVKNRSKARGTGLCWA